MEMQCRTCDPPRLSPIHMVRRAGGQQLVMALMGGSRMRAAWSAEDALQTGKEAPSAPRVAESQAYSRGRNIAG